MTINDALELLLLVLSIIAVFGCITLVILCSEKKSTSMDELVRRVATIRCAVTKTLKTIGGYITKNALKGLRRLKEVVKMIKRRDYYRLVWGRFKRKW